MKRKIKLTRNQISEIVDGDFDYLDDGNDYNGYKGNSEVTTSSNLSNGEPGTPIDTDEYANTMSPRWYYGMRSPRAGYVVACSKDNKNKDKIFEENSDLKYRKYVIPDELYMNLKNILDQYTDKTKVPGYKRLNNLLQNKNVSYSDMKRIKNFFDTFQGKETDITFVMNGGNKMKDWVNNELQTSRDAIHNVKDAEMKSGIENAFIKTHTKDRMTKNPTKVTKPEVNDSEDKSKELDNGKMIHYENVKRKIRMSESQINNFIND